MNKAILSILGRDRPGIVAAVSRALFEQNCNIENVSQTMLQTEFAGIFIVSLTPGVAAEDLHRGLCERLSPLGLHVHTKPCESGDYPCATAPCEPFVITTRGPDRKGLVAGRSRMPPVTLCSRSRRVGTRLARGRSARPTPAIMGLVDAMAVPFVFRYARHTTLGQRGMKPR